MTIPTQLVLLVLLDEPDRERYGLELGELAGLATGTIHPILARLEKVGWVQSRWEQIEPHQEGRPRRRYYRLAGMLMWVLADARRATRLTRLIREIRAPRDTVEPSKRTL